VLEELGDLEAAWSDPHARGRFLALPIEVVEHMLGHCRFKVERFSEASLMLVVPPGTDNV
jgi:hypothetical protein